MKYLFADQNIYEKLEKEIMEWINTPFFWNACVKGRGVDCSHFLEVIGIHIGILDEFLKFNLPINWYETSERELLYESFITVLNNLRDDLSYLEINGNGVFRGDLCLFSIKSKRMNHSGIYLEGNRLVHVFPDVGLVIHPFHGFWERHLRKIFRLVKLWD